jgi:hypothetical protein
VRGIIFVGVVLGFFTIAVLFVYACQLIARERRRELGERGRTDRLGGRARLSRVRLLAPERLG